MPQLSQGVLGSALMMVIKERISLIIRGVLFGIFLKGRVA